MENLPEYYECIYDEDCDYRCVDYNCIDRPSVQFDLSENKYLNLDNKDYIKARFARSDDSAELRKLNMLLKRKLKKINSNKHNVDMIDDYNRLVDIYNALWDKIPISLQ